MKYLIGNILDVDEGYILHQVNCRRVAGAGLAKQIADKYPDWKRDYVSKFAVLGLTHLYQVNTEKDLIIVNLYGQDGVGRDKQYTDYNALENSMRVFMDNFYSLNLPIYIPFKIGCGLGGGDWTAVREIIGKTIPEAIIVKLPEETDN